MTVLDDAPAARCVDADLGEPEIEFVNGRDAVARAIRCVDLVVKSPGISLYDPLVARAKAEGVAFTSLLNLWFGAGPTARTIGVTGTKGKSTTTALLGHLLRRHGHTVSVVGNIGDPVTVAPLSGIEFVVIEVSSYQAADFDGICDIAVLTSLSQEHLDWHGSVEAYHRDKLNLLRHSRYPVINADSLGRAGEILDLAGLSYSSFNSQGGLHAAAGRVYQGNCDLGAIAEPYLARPHNAGNLCAALAVLARFGIEPREALARVDGFGPLPHRQQELGTVEGVLYVNDSISTTPEATLAALASYPGRPITLLLGGFDRGVDYSGLVEALRQGAASTVVLLGPSGTRIRRELEQDDSGLAEHSVHIAASLTDAVAWARRHTPAGGVILLSPASPSYDSYPNFVARGEDFARCAGLMPPKR